MLSNQTTFEKIFINDNKGHKSLTKWLKKKGKAFRVCLEATGVYYLTHLTQQPLATAIH